MINNATRKPPQPSVSAIAPKRGDMLDLDTELAALDAMSIEDLRERWTSLTGTPAPRVRAGLLRTALAWELQAAVHGGLSRRTRQRLARDTKPGTPAIEAAPGMRLAREWNGVLHTVTIGEDGAIIWNGRSWNSLSEVARAITGTRWSGPVFFGLRPGKKAA